MEENSQNRREGGFRRSDSNSDSFRKYNNQNSFDRNNRDDDSGKPKRKRILRPVPKDGSDTPYEKVTPTPGQGSQRPFGRNDYNNNNRSNNNNRGGQRPYNKPFNKGGNNFKRNNRREDEGHYRDMTPEQVQKEKDKNSRRYQKYLEWKARFAARPPKVYTLPTESDDVRLNKFLANAGVASRREADKIIQDGRVTINDQVVTTLGTRVRQGDIVKYNGTLVNREKPIYLLLNKPKDSICTMDDPEGRNTVMELVKGATDERIFPVGRLDRNTTGLLLFTNDGDLAQKLTHPKFNIRKIYLAVLDKRLKPKHMEKIHSGFELEDGFIKADAISFVDNEDQKQVGIELHSGRNRIVHRIFKHFGYKVDKLDRAYYAGLTKKDLKRGQWRFLSEKEVGHLKKLVDKTFAAIEN